MTSQFDLTWFYDVIICNSVFQLGFLTREFQIPKYTSKFSTSWYYHIWLAWPGMLKVLKITSIMQYLCNITEKWVTKLKFYMLINISFLQVDTFVFVCLVRHVQSTQTSLHYLNIQERNIRDFYKFILSFLTGVARHVQSTPKEQVCKNGMLDYLDFWFVHRPPIHETNLLHVSIKDY